MGDIVDTFHMYLTLNYGVMESNRVVGCKTTMMSMSKIEYWV